MSLSFIARQRRIDACGAGVCLALLAASYFGVVRPYLVAESQARDDAHELADLRHKQAERSAEWRATQQNLREVERTIAAMPFKLRAVSQVNSHLASVVELAKSAGLTVQDMSPGAPIPGKRSVSVPIRLRGTGGFLAATSFLRQLHARFVDTRVTAFTLNADLGAVDAPASFSFELAWHAVPNELAGDK